MAGWISISRKFLESDEWVSEKFTRPQAWIDLIGLARFSDFDKSGKPHFMRVRGIKVFLKRGQIGYGSDKLASRWGWSRNKVIRFLNELQEEHQIELQKNNVTTVISIVNYDAYQSNEQAKSNIDEAPKGKPERQQKDNRRSQLNNDNNGITTNNNEKQTIPYQEIIDLIISIPNAIKPRKITDTHKADIKARWNKEGKSIDAFKEVVDLCKSSKFLCGEVRPSEGHKQFRISINWILNKKNWDKVISGQYQDQSNNGQTNSTSQEEELRRQWAEDDKRREELKNQETIDIIL